MKKVITLTLVASILGVATIGSAEFVQGHYRKNGTYVDGYMRTDRNDTEYDNYSYNNRNNRNKSSGIWTSQKDSFLNL